MGECLHRLGARLPNEKSDLITPPLPQLSELVFLIRVRRNYSSLRDGRWCGGGSGGGEGDGTMLLLQSVPQDAIGRQQLQWHKTISRMQKHINLLPLVDFIGLNISIERHVKHNVDFKRGSGRGEGDSFQCSVMLLSFKSAYVAIDCPLLFKKCPQRHDGTCTEYFHDDLVCKEY